MTISRRTLLAAAGAGAAVLAAAPSTQAAGGRPVVRRGRAYAVVVIDDAARPAVRKAAQELVSIVARVTGIELPTASLPSAPPPAGYAPIYIGFAGPESGDAVTELLDGLGDDGFVIAPHQRALTILGVTEWGTLNGVYEYAERFLGVSWLMPTDDGEYLPALSSVVMPTETIRQEPAFLQRMLSPLTIEPGKPGAYPEQYHWAQRNRIQGSYNQPISFHHNLYSLFPVSEFGTTHPEYYPNGKPPAPGVTTGWQPAFTVPGTIDVAVTKIMAFFAANPAARSFSLGVNDSGGFAEADPVGPYYSWVNSVVSRILADFPDKKFGLLAYHQLETPPSFPLNPSVVPFFTQDRMAWADPAVASASKARLQLWSTVASQLGFYDYIYGSPYLVPRVFPHLSQDIYRYAKQLGIVAHYAELYPNWGEGPKPWLTAKLMWNPDLNVDALLGQWYERAVGPDAAPYLAQYYELWESFWTERAIATPWFQPDVTYQAFNSGGYLNAVQPEDISTSRTLIDTMLANPGTPGQQVRAQKIARAFDYYEASAATFPRDLPAPAGAAAALDVLENLENTWRTRLVAAQRRLDLVAEFKNDPILVHPLDPNVYGLVWGAWNKAEFWGIVDYLTRHETSGGPVTDWLAARQNPTQVDDFTDFARMVKGIVDGTLLSSVANSSFEGGVSPWSMWVATAGQILYTTSVTHSGSGGLVVKALGRGGPAQVFPIRPGLAASRAHLRTPTESAYRGTAQFALNLQDSAGRQIGRILGNIIPITPSGANWFTVDSLDAIPASINGQAVAKAQYVLILNGFTDDPDFYVDDIAVYQAPIG